STSIRVPVPRLWDVLMDSIQNPQDYLPGILQCKIVRQTGKEIIRKVKTAVGEFFEQIIVDMKNLTISFRLLTHPDYTGTTTSPIVATNDETGMLLLTLTRQYEPKFPHMIAEPKPESLREALDNVKRSAELR
ncbi:MAG: AtaL-like protein, partial [Bacteroidota bacterium]